MIGRNALRSPLLRDEKSKNSTLSKHLYADNDSEAVSAISEQAKEPADSDSPAEGAWHKRTLDILGSLALLIFFAPLMAIIYFVVRSDGGPAIFSQQRVGKDGKLFRCYKFRSMIPNAEEVLKDILVCNEQFRKDWETDQKLRNDPRITRVGAFLRRKSFDELPQLINILRGDMSLVGPRPIIPDEVPRYGANISFYYSVKPGLTGAWQVSGRNNVSYEERVALDVTYSKSWSFLNDISILVRTVGVVLTGRGAL